MPLSIRHSYCIILKGNFRDSILHFLPLRPFMPTVPLGPKTHDRLGGIKYWTMLFVREDRSSEQLCQALIMCFSGSV